MADEHSATSVSFYRYVKTNDRNSFEFLARLYAICFYLFTIRISKKFHKRPHGHRLMSEAAHIISSLSPLSAKRYSSRRNRLISRTQVLSGVYTVEYKVFSVAIKEWVGKISKEKKKEKKERFTLSLVSLLAISFLVAHVILSLEYPTIPRRALAVFLALRVLFVSRKSCVERRSSRSLHRGRILPEIKKRWKLMPLKLLLSDESM